jgi:flagellar biosynthetic protein FliP
VLLKNVMIVKRGAAPSVAKRNAVGGCCWSAEGSDSVDFIMALGWENLYMSHSGKKVQHFRIIMLALQTTPIAKVVQQSPLLGRGGTCWSVLMVILLLSCPTHTNAQERSASGSERESLLSRALKNRENSGLQNAVAQNIQQTLGGDTDATSTDELASKILGGPDAWLSPKGLSSSLQILLLLTVLSLAPAILLMTTCYVRVIVVFGLLKQALGAQQLPPSQIITSISLFITIFVMSPVWTQVYNDAIEPYTQEGSQMSATEAWEAGVAPVRDFMARQITVADNEEDVFLFYSRYAPGSSSPKNFDEVPLQVLLPAYMLSELKTAFLMGFKIYLPFLILDIVIASVTVSMGMMMLPPAMISMPFKLLLFVLVDGWRLVVEMLLASFGTISG